MTESRRTENDDDDDDTVIFDENVIKELSDLYGDDLDTSALLASIPPGLGILATAKNKKKATTREEDGSEIVATNDKENNSLLVLEKDDTLEEEEEEKKNRPTLAKRCNFCSSTFESKLDYLEHVRNVHPTTITNQGGLSLKCEEEDCRGKDSSFGSFNKFRVHMESVHKLLAFKCDICGNRFSTQTTLRHHKITHNGEKRFLCDVCGKKFKTRDQCSSHRLVHGEKTLNCDLCGKGFKMRNVLFQHRASHFPKRFACQFAACSKKFSTKQNLESHCRTHTGEKPYKCSVCGSAFKRYHHLKKHIQSYTHLERIMEMKAAGKSVPRDLDPYNDVATAATAKTTNPGVVVIPVQLAAQVDACDLCPGLTSAGFRSEHHFQRHIRSRSHVTRVLEQNELGIRIPSHLIASDLIVEEEDIQVVDGGAVRAVANEAVDLESAAHQAIVLDGSGGEIIYLAAPVTRVDKDPPGPPPPRPVVVQQDDCWPSEDDPSGSVVVVTATAAENDIATVKF